MGQNNSFKPYKCLLYKDNFDGIINRKLQPPIEVNIDPINICNLKCSWCNASKVMNGKKIEKDDMFKLLEELADWGVKGICFAGGGEPTLHPNLIEFIDKCRFLGLESSMITNGYRMSDDLKRSIVNNMRWVGISVDCCSQEKFLKIKKVDGFLDVYSNIHDLVDLKKDLNSKIGITFKYLINQINQLDIYESCRTAKQLGCDSFHVRPVDFLAFQNKEDDLNVEFINEQTKKCLDLEDENFEVIPYFINFKDDLKRKIEFDNCLLSPLLGVCLPNGWWLCIDQKGKDGLWLCDIHDIREFWGSKKHFDIMNKINPKHDCGKCTLAKYYPWFDIYKEDKFYWKFV